MLYDSEEFKANVEGEGNIDNLCGWAGDLQTLCIEVLDYTSNSNDYDTVYSATYDLIGEDAYSLSMMDLLADTDAYNIYRLINSSSSNFISAFTTYYDDYVGTITDTQANAIASAFTDFIWEKIQYE